MVSFSILSLFGLQGSPSQVVNIYRFHGPELLCEPSPMDESKLAEHISLQIFLLVFLIKALLCTDQSALSLLTG